MENVEIAKALFEALAGRDDRTVRMLCAPGFRVRQNNGRPMDIEKLLAFSGAVHGVLKGFRYANPVRQATSTGFIEEHMLQGELPDGSAINMAICIVADLQDGKVVEVREYFDSAAAAGLVAALA